MRKISYFILNFALMVLLLSGTAWAALNVSPGNIEGQPGDEIVVPIKVSNPGAGLQVNAFSFLIHFDSSVLTAEINPSNDEFAGIDKTGTFAEDFSGVNGIFKTDGSIKIQGWTIVEPYPTIGAGTSDMVFVNLKFKIKDDATKSSALTLSDFKDNFTGASTTDSMVEVDILDARPTNLEARSSIDSIKLLWEPGANAYVDAYNVYRSTSEDGGYVKIGTVPVGTDYYIDNDSSLEKGVRYYYYLTVVDTFGIESEPIDPESAVLGGIRFFIPDSKGKPETQVRLPVNIDNADGLQMCSADFYITYNSDVLEARDIERTPLSEEYSWAKNLNTPGVARAVISDTEAKATLNGEGALFYVLFDVVGEIGDISELEFQIESTAFFDCSDPFNSLPLDLSDIGVFTVVGDDECGFLGDLNKDCVVDSDDRDMANEIAVGLIEVTEDLLIAGDVSGDGKIMSNDATLIMRIANGESLVPASGGKRNHARSSSVSVSVPDDIAVPAGASTWVPIQINDVMDVLAADIILNYDPAFITAGEARTTLTDSNFDVKANVSQPGVVKISFGSKDTEGLSDGSATLVEVLFTAKSDVSGNGKSPLTLTRARLSDAYSRNFATSALQVEVKTDSGSLKVISLRDAIEVLNVLTGKVSGDVSYLDVTGDDKVGTEDAIHILQVLSEADGS